MYMLQGKAKGNVDVNRRTNLRSRQTAVGTSGAGSMHFIEYLSSKVADRAEITDLTRAQETVMKHVWDNQDDEIWNDVKTL